jgi:hypothetical protein
MLVVSDRIVTKSQRVCTLAFSYHGGDPSLLLCPDCPDCPSSPPFPACWWLCALCLVPHLCDSPPCPIPWHSPSSATMACVKRLMPAPRPMAWASRRSGSCPLGAHAPGWWCTPWAGRWTAAHMAVAGFTTWTSGESGWQWWGRQLQHHCYCSLCRWLHVHRHTQHACVFVTMLCVCCMCVALGMLRSHPALLDARLPRPPASLSSCPGATHSVCAAAYQ